MSQSFQNILGYLQDSWRKQDFVSLPSWDMPVGAGTLSPHTALRLIEGKDQKVMYLQACRRPSDESDSTHLRRHHQFQVVSRPIWGNITSMFRESLGTLLDDHDVQFVDATWENPAIGASGHGFEVLVNGIEVAQLTTFTRIGRQKCKPTNEIAYGIERLAMVLSGLTNIRDIAWDWETSYRDHFPDEDELAGMRFHSCVSNIRQMRQGLDNRLKHQNARGLPYYENILEVSDLINRLDARDALAPEAKTYYIRKSCDLMEALVLDKFEDVTPQPFHQIYHPLIGLSHDHNDRVNALAENYPSQDESEAIMRLVSLWGVGEGVTGGNDPYQMKESAKVLARMSVADLGSAIAFAKNLMRNNKQFKPDAIDSLEHFILNANN